MKTYTKWLLPVLAGTMLITGCQKDIKTETPKKQAVALKQEMPNRQLTDEKSRVYYEIFVRSFSDSNGDGIGDINGVTEKLDYLKDLGVEGIWLMPIYPSPSYHGYDIKDYKNVNTDYGTLEDMKKLVEEAHKRGIHVLLDMVMNHTSKENPWFQKALAGDPYYRDFYVWAKEDTSRLKKGDWGQLVWQGSGNNTYEGLFSPDMPDLNYDNPNVRNEMISAGAFWMKDIGVDGFRMDAAKYLYSSFETPDYVQKNIGFWNEFRNEMEKINPNVMVVGEVWDSPSVIGPYLKGLNSGFNFDLSTKIISTVKSGRDAGISSSLSRTLAYYKTQNESFIDSTFITNHDMNRIMSEVGGDENKAKMAASLLFTLPGNPYIYYGEETGMTGVKPDERIREPFAWDEKKSNEETTWENSTQDRGKVALSKQMQDENSLYNHYKEMIKVRKSSEALLSGNIEPLSYTEEGIVSFKRTSGNESLLIFHNVSDKSVTVDIKEKEYNKLYYSTYKATSVKGKVKIPPYSTLIVTK